MPRMRLEKLGKYGLNTDVQPYLLPPETWTSMYNCRTQDGELRSVVGEKKLFDISIRPLYHKSYVGPSGLQYLVVSDGLKVILYDIQGLETDITPTTGDLTGGYVSIVSLNGILVVNSETDGLFYWPGVGDVLEPNPGWDPSWRCKEIAAYRYFLVALNMTEGVNRYPYKVRWSNSAQEGSLPTEWIAAESNDAGADIIGETPGDIVGGRLVRDSLYIVKDDAIYEMRYVAGDFIMELSRMKGDIGTRLQRGFEEMLGGLVVFTTSDLMLFDGTKSTSIVDERVRNGIFSGISEELWELSQVFVHKPSSTLFLAGVEAGYRQLSTALTYNWEENTWGSRRIAYSYGFDSALVTVSGGLPSWDELAGPGPAGDGPKPMWIEGEPWDNQVDGSWNKGVYQPSVPDIIIYQTNDEDTAWWVSVVALVNTNYDGSPKTCQAERIAIPIEGAEGLAQVNRIWPEVRGDAPLSMWVGSQMAANGPVTWDGPYVITPGATESIDPRITGRYIALRVKSNSNGRWSLGAITAEWESAGER